MDELQNLEAHLIRFHSDRSPKQISKKKAISSPPPPILIQGILKGQSEKEIMDSGQISIEEAYLRVFGAPDGTNETSYSITYAGDGRPQMTSSSARKTRPKTQISPQQKSQPEAELRDSTSPSEIEQQIRIIPDTPAASQSQMKLQGSDSLFAEINTTPRPSTAPIVAATSTSSTTRIRVVSKTKTTILVSSGEKQEEIGNNIEPIKYIDQAAENTDLRVESSLLEIPGETLTFVSQPPSIVQGIEETTSMKEEASFSKSQSGSNTPTRALSKKSVVFKDKLIEDSPELCESSSSGGTRSRSKSPEGTSPSKSSLKKASKDKSKKAFENMPPLLTTTGSNFVDTKNLSDANKLVQAIQASPLSPQKKKFVSKIPIPKCRLTPVPPRLTSSTKAKPTFTETTPKVETRKSTQARMRPIRKQTESNTYAKIRAAKKVPALSPIASNTSKKAKGDGSPVESDEKITTPIDGSPIVSEENISVDESPVVSEENIPIDESPLVSDENIPVEESPLVSVENISVDQSPLTSQDNLPVDESPLRVLESNLPKVSSDPLDVSDGEQGVEDESPPAFYASDTSTCSEKSDEEDDDKSDNNSKAEAESTTIVFKSENDHQPSTTYTATAVPEVLHCPKIETAVGAPAIDHEELNKNGIVVTNSKGNTTTVATTSSVINHNHRTHTHSHAKTTVGEKGKGSQISVLSSPTKSKGTCGDEVKEAKTTKSGIIPCRYAAAGCTEELPRGTLTEEEHYRECRYRPIPCLFNQVCNEIVPYHNFILHHQSHFLYPNYCRSYVSHVIIQPDDFLYNQSWIPKWLSFSDNHFFLMLNHTRGKQVGVGSWVCWVCMLGTEEEAVNYYYEVEIFKGLKKLSGAFTAQSIRTGVDKIEKTKSGLVFNDAVAKNISDIGKNEIADVFIDVTITRKPPYHLRNPSYTGTYRVVDEEKADE